MTLDRTMIRETSKMTDPLGVLSIYANVDATEEASYYLPAWWVRVDNALDALSREVREHGTRDQDLALRHQRKALEPELNQMLDAARFGRGRAMFAPLSGGEVTQLSIQLPWPDQVVCESTGYVRPLLDAWASGSPAGIAVASRDGLRIVDYRFGIAEDVASLEFAPDTNDWQEYRGPATSSRYGGQRSVRHDDLFDFRLDAHLRKFLAAGHRTLHRLADEHDWEFLVVVGEPQLRQAVVDNLGSTFRIDVVDSPRTAGDLTASQVAQLVADDLDAARQRREEALVDRVAGAKLAAQGVDQTLAAVQQGQAETVLMSRDGHWTGRRSDDGHYVADGVVPPGVDCGDLHDEPNLAERIIEMAMDTDAELVMMHPEAAQRLPESDGLAAVMRW